ncbi:hypothetical protein AcW1_005523 [Taiwanofungus camphoratus]|nr:hypothetical protein AcW2_004292 [Antrodia cinnamomea]KAI0933793.1 hypothetical protein AcV5_005845 [Antrodia cinnamomea]KAI0956983.1 hypothetical protein AcW1_005523 [Antrodia cinnamomea]
MHTTRRNNLRGIEIIFWSQTDGSKAELEKASRHICQVYRRVYQWIYHHGTLHSPFRIVSEQVVPGLVCARESSKYQFASSLEKPALVVRVITAGLNKPSLVP